MRLAFVGLALLAATLSAALAAQGKPVEGLSRPGRLTMQEGRTTP
ncbi:hypothetical protein [Infirmifilum uzonense]|nr:hypothetical protein [Infirmifilum uzonense]